MGELLGFDSEKGLEMGDAEEQGKQERESSDVVRWEEFMPRMVITVLLVESDDSTRQIIAALLRNCNYKVAAIPDGLKAWEILKQKHNNIDLILTEVDLPSISGFALLTLIMGHDSCKNIPVIMMSSSDSMSMVFKCMLKGAADFLIKPVRRNELKNLWQHVWRRISANNRSGVQNLCGSYFQAEAPSTKRATGNCSDDNVSSSSKNSRSTEKACNTQSSCATRYMENAYVEDTQGLSRMKHQGASNSSHDEVQQHQKGMRLEEENEEEKSTRLESSGVAHGDEAYTSTLRLERVGSSSGRVAHYKRIESASCKNVDNMPNGEINEHARQAIDLIGTIDNHHERRLRQPTSNVEVNISSTTQLDLSLRGYNNPDNRRKDGVEKLSHSNASAFSRYSSSNKLRTVFPSSGNSSTEIKLVNAVSSDEENKSTVITGPSSHPVFPVPQLGLTPVPVVGFRGISTGYGQRTIVLKPTNQEESSLLSSPLQSDQETYCLSHGHSGFDETSNNEEKVSASQSADNSAASGSVCEGNDDTNQAMVRMDNGSNMVMNEEFGREKDAHHNSYREAALAKFRQKRKDRCFEKKVRYQSRKRLAEQRPRVKGQFVRQVQTNQLPGDTDH